MGIKPSIAGSKENKPLDKKTAEMKENLVVLEVKITSASGELQKLKAQQEELTPLAAIQGWICNLCHQSGHMKTTCKARPCEGSYNCNIQEKHPEIKTNILSLQAELKELQKQHEKHRSELESFMVAREKSKSSFFCNKQSTALAEFTEIHGSFETRQRSATGVKTCITK